MYKLINGYASIELKLKHLNNLRRKFALIKDSQIYDKINN